MYKILIYRGESGYSEVKDYFDDLLKRSPTNKNARIQFKQITFYIEFLERYGNHLSNNIIKHISEDIWELRPGNNRVLYFQYENETFILLHVFRKKTQKTPTKEIEKAKRRRNKLLSKGVNYDYLGKI